MNTEAVAGRVVKTLHQGYTTKLAMPWLSDDDVKKYIGTHFEKIDGVWHRDMHFQYAIEFMDGSILYFDSCGCCDGVDCDWVRDPS